MKEIFSQYGVTVISVCSGISILCIFAKLLMGEQSLLRLVILEYMIGLFGGTL